MSVIIETSKPIKSSTNLVMKRTKNENYLYNLYMIVETMRDVILDLKTHYGI